VLKTSESDALYPFLLNLMAYNDVLMMDPRLLEEADESSRKAMESGSDIAAIRGTRGAVLTMKGDIKGARKLLMSSYKGGASSGSRAADAAWIAVGYAVAGDRRQSLRWLNIARMHKPEAPEVALAEDRIRKLKPESVLIS